MRSTRRWIRYRATRQQERIQEKLALAFGDLLRHHCDFVHRQSVERAFINTQVAITNSGGACVSHSESAKSW